MLRRLARAVTALVAFFALQMVGVGSAAAACVLGSHGPAVSGASAATRGAEMPGLVTGATRSAPASGGVADGGLAAPPGDDSSCDHGAAPERCTSAPACAAFVPGHATVERDVAHGLTDARVAPLTVLAPASLTSPPDFRPPRA